MLDNFLGKIGDYVTVTEPSKVSWQHMCFDQRVRVCSSYVTKNRAMKQHFKPYEFLSDIRHLQNFKG